MSDLLKNAGGCRADLARRAVGPHQLRKMRLDLLVAPLQRVIVRVRNLRRILAVIERIVSRQFGRQPFQLCYRIFKRQIFNGNG